MERNKADQQRIQACSRLRTKRDENDWKYHSFIEEVRHLCRTEGKCRWNLEECFFPPHSSFAKHCWLLKLIAQPRRSYDLKLSSRQRIMKRRPSLFQATSVSTKQRAVRNTPNIRYYIPLPARIFTQYMCSRGESPHLCIILYSKGTHRRFRIIMKWICLDSVDKSKLRKKVSCWTINGITNGNEAYFGAQFD